MKLLLCLTLMLASGALAKGPLDCVGQKDAVICDDMEQCVWCENSKVGGACYPMKAAKLLPKKMFACDKIPDVKGPADKAQPMKGVHASASLRGDTCDKKPEASCIAPDCVWCTSAAVGGGCYTPEQAKLLPSAIFKCKTAPSA